jgi:hypothetical protein
MTLQLKTMRQIATDLGMRVMGAQREVANMVATYSQQPREPYLQIPEAVSPREGDQCIR